MMYSVVNRSGVLIGKAFGVVGQLFVGTGFVPNFLLMDLYSYFLSLFSRGCMSHLGITTIAFVGEIGGKI